MVDFSKAFNRQNHNILVTKLSDMGVPAWLLKIVMSFLSDRIMVVRYNGATSSIQSLPGGGPQGTLLGLLLFIILINDVGFKNQINNVGELITCKKRLREANQMHLKYVDDLTLAESLILKNNLIQVPDSERVLPENFHDRTGHRLIPENSKVLEQIQEVHNYAKTNDMKLNMKKTKFMMFNKSKKYDFSPKFCLEGQDIELVEEMKILGVVVTSDLKFNKNTDYMIKRAYKRIWILRRLKNLHASNSQLKDIYIKQVRSVLEQAVPLWQPSLPQYQKTNIERVQKAALKIIYGNTYNSYSTACETAELLTLEDRRLTLCRKFTFKSLKHPKHMKWFKLNTKCTNTRREQPKFAEVFSRSSRFDNSPIPYMTNILKKCK